MTPRTRARQALTAAVITGGVALASTALAPAQAKPARVTSEELRQAVTVRGLMDHLRVLQRIADDNGGNRFSGLPGHDDSVDYAAGVFRAAGFKVEVQPFDYLAYAELGPGTLEQTAPGTETYEQGVDWDYLDQTDPADVTASVTAVDLALGPDNASTSGCEIEDFASFPAGDIALIQRGTCTFEQKIENAAAAGAVGAVFFNQGNTEDRKGLAAITLGADNTSGIPGVFATYDRGVEWAGTEGLELRVVTDTLRESATTYNVLAESRWGNPKNVVMAGAHLDSVGAGPGINDNGSGSAAILEVAEQLSALKARTKNKIRFGLWGAEESGLVGSDHYVASLTEEERERIALYLNFDMIGSPNFGRFIYDGDNSAFPVGPGAAEGPAGSGQIEALFRRHFDNVKLTSAETPFSGRSDYGPFIEVGIPAGGLFTGAEGIKTEEQAAAFGGVAGASYDSCYHQACDTLTNVDKRVFQQMADAVAHAVLTYAKSTRSLGVERAVPARLRATGADLLDDQSGGVHADHHGHGHGETAR